MTDDNDAVAKQRRLRVASSLFMPKIKPLQDEVNPESTESSTKTRSSCWLTEVEAEAVTNSPRGTSASKQKYIKKSIYSRKLNMSCNSAENRKSHHASRPYDPRVTSTSWANQCKQPNKYTSKLAARLALTETQEAPRSFERELAMIIDATQPPPSSWKKKAHLSRSTSEAPLHQNNTCETPTQSQVASLPPVEDFVVICDEEPSQVDSKSQVIYFYTENEQIAQETSTQTQQPPSPLADTFIIISDTTFVTASTPPTVEENGSENCHHASTQTQRSSTPAVSSFLNRNDEPNCCYAPDGTVIPEVSSSFHISQAVTYQNQQVPWQMSVPSQSRSPVALSAAPNIAPNPLPPELSVPHYENTLHKVSFQGPTNRFHGTEQTQPRIYLPPDENSRILSMLSPPSRPPVYRQEAEPVPISHTAYEITRIPEVSVRSAPSKKPTKSRRKPTERSKQQNTQNPKTPPDNIYQESYPHSYNHFGCPKPVCAQQFMYFICPQSGSHMPTAYSSENCHSYGHPHMIPSNHTALEMRYRPYQCVGRPAIMYHPAVTEPPPLQNPPSAAPLPASLAPADMANWLASRYQKTIPPPQPEYSALERQLSDYQQALTRYSLPPQNGNSYMKSFCEQYAGAVCSNPSKLTGNYYPDNRSPPRNYGLPKMMDSGQSSCGPHLGYFPRAKPAMNCTSSAPMFSMGHIGHSQPMPSYHSRHVHYEQPAAIRFPSHSQKPIDSGHIPSNISPAMRRLSINEQVPEEFYRNMMNVPEYDPRDNR